MIRALHTLSDGLNRVTELVLVPLVVAFFGVVFVTVVTRYVFGTSLVSSVELTRLSFLWACFLAATVGVKRYAHIRFVVVVDLFPPVARNWIQVLVVLVELAFFAMMVWHGWILTDRVSATYLPALEWSQGLLYLALPVSGAIMFVHGLSALADAVAGCRAPAGQAAASTGEGRV